MEKKRRKGGYFLLSVSVVLCLFMISAVYIFMPSKIEDTAVSYTDALVKTLSAGTPSVINIDNSGEEKDYFSSDVVQGAQNEYIYFGTNFAKGTNGNSGTNAHEGAIKWQVLANGDTKYGDGTTFLLYADYQIALAQYNGYHSSQYYAFWGTSKLRATLNGGAYLNPSGNAVLDQTVNTSDAWINNIFSVEENKSIKTSSSYDTQHWRTVSSNTPRFTTTNLLGTSLGQYSPEVMSSSAASFAEAVDGKVIEKMQDKLFILDYSDLNNADWGFYDLQSDGTKLVYGAKVIPGWTMESDGFPGYDDRGNNGSIRSDYLKISRALIGNTWIRNAGHYSDQARHAIVLSTNGYIGCTYMTTSNGVRPAFNLSPERVIYATAADISSIGNTFNSVNSINSSDGKPAYKVYLKTDDYINYNSYTSGMPEINVSDGKITVTKSGQSGKAIFLLTDKSKSGQVVYQAEADFSGGVATAIMPSGENIGKYTVTVLFANDLNGDVYSENITGSYTYNIFDIPSDVSVVYNGEARNQKDFEGKSWYYQDFYKNKDIIDVTIPTGAIHKNEYSVKISLKGKHAKWSDGSISDKNIKLTVTAKSIGITWTQDGKGVYSAAPNSTEVCAADKMNINGILHTHYTNAEGSYDSDTAPINIGKYTARAVIDNADYSIKSNNEKEFEILPIKVPVFTADNFNPADSQAYNGKVRSFGIRNYEYRLVGSTDEAPVEISVPDRFADKVTIDRGYFVVREAGEYAISLSLTDKVNSQWADMSDTDPDRTKDREVKFTVTKVDLNAIVIAGATDGIVKAAIGEKVKITVEIPALCTDKEGLSDEIEFRVCAYSEGSKDATPLSDFITVDAENDYIIELDTSDLRFEGDYILKFELSENVADSGNYNLLIDDLTLKLSEDNGDGKVIWRLYDEKGAAVGAAVRVDIGTLTAQFNQKIVYGPNKFYTFTASANDYEVDMTNENDFVDGYKGRTFGDAGVHTTQVRLKNKNDPSDIQVYSITWTIDPYKFDLSNVKWQNNGKVEYTGSQVSLTLENLPDGLIAQSYERNTGTNVDSYGPATVHFGLASGYDVNNYIIPIPTYTDNVADSTNSDAYIGSFEWEKEWEITQAIIKVGKGDWKNAQNSDEANPFSYKVLSDPRAEGVVEYVYYESDRNGNPIDITKPLQLSDITVSATEKKMYIAVPSIKAGFENNYKFPDGLTDKDKYSPVFEIGGGSTAVEVRIDSDKIEYYNGKPRNVKLVITGSAKESDLTVTYYKGDVVDEAKKLEGAPTEVGKYLAVITSNNPNVILSGTTQYEFEITQSQVGKEWNKNYKPYVLNLKYGQINGVKYEIRDKDGNTIEDISQLTVGNSYEIRAVIKDGNYIFADGSTETDWETFEVREGDQLFDPNSPNNPNYPQNDPEDGNKPSDPDGDKDEDGNTSFDKVLKVIKEWWQVVASGISIVLIIVFTAKGIGYASKRKENKKTIESRYKTYYATGLFGLSMTKWTIMAGVLMGAAVIAFVFMLIEKRGYKKSVRELEDAKEEYLRNEKDSDNRRREQENQRRDEDMKMMFMHMMGGGNMNGGANGQAQGGFVYAQPSLGADEIRGIVSETMTAMLPNMQQYLPQQASTNDEIVQRLIEQNAANEERMRQLNEQNEERIERLMEKLSERNADRDSTSDEVVQKLIEQNEKLMKKLSEQPIEKVVEREVAATTVNDETIRHMMNTQENLMRNQEKLMEKILQLSANGNTQERQVIEKIVEKPVEKIVEKEVRVEVPVEVEKVVEKIVEKEVKVEVPAAKPTAPKKPVAPRLTLDEAYAKLSKEQKKFFDTLRNYAMSKDKCKEKKSTYFILLGQSSVNPLVKLTVKKDTTVALFKMEDEYFKDIRRNAGSDGTKMKIKETELIVSDAQAFDTAKEMIDLREDQIERYQEYLKEQKSMKR